MNPIPVSGKLYRTNIYPDCPSLYLGMNVSRGKSNHVVAIKLGRDVGLFNASNYSLEGSLLNLIDFKEIKKVRDIEIEYLSGLFDVKLSDFFIRGSKAYQQL